MVRLREETPLSGAERGVGVRSPGQTVTAGFIVVLV